MELSPYFKSIIDQDRCQVVICDPQHTIIYMNPAAVKAYEKRGGAALVGRCLLDCHSPVSVDRIREVSEWFAADPSHNLVHTAYSETKAKDIYMIALRDENGTYIGYYEKHEFRTRDDMPLYDLHS